MKILNYFRLAAFTLLPAFVLVPVQAYDLDAAVDTDAIRAIFENKVEAWNAGDADAWGADYASDAVVINMHGSRLDGRLENIERHREVFAGGLADTTLQVEVMDIDYAAPGIALVETALSVFGLEDAPAGVIPTEPNILRTRMTFVVAPNEEGLWQIRFAQNTAIAPM